MSERYEVSGDVLWDRWLGSDIMVPDIQVQCDKLNAHDDLVAALKWYVENDDTHEQDGNEFWLAGKQRAKAALAKAEGAK